MQTERALSPPESLTPLNTQLHSPTTSSVLLHMCTCMYSSLPPLSRPFSSPRPLLLHASSVGVAAARSASTSACL